jgi:hypothetical protein
MNGDKGSSSSARWLQRTATQKVEENVPQTLLNRAGCQPFAFDVFLKFAGKGLGISPNASRTHEYGAISAGTCHMGMDKR